MYGHVMNVLSNVIIWNLVIISPAVCPRWWWSKTTNLCDSIVLSPEPETAVECMQECETQCGQIIRKGHPPVPIKTGVFKVKNGKHLCKCQFSGGLYLLIKQEGRSEKELKKHERNIKEARKWLNQNGFRLHLVSFSKDTLPLKPNGDSEMTPERCASTCRGSMGCVVYHPKSIPIAATGHLTQSKGGMWTCICETNLEVSKTVKAVGLNLEEFLQEFFKGGSASCNWLRANKFKVYCPDDSPEHAELASSSSEPRLQRAQTMKTLRRMPAIQRGEEQPSSLDRESNGSRSPSTNKLRKGANDEN